jgi:DNA-binding NtrC family response regulator
MKVQKNTGEPNDKTTLSTGLEPDGPREVRVLIISEDDSIAQPLAAALSEAGYIWERARSITAGCESARSGRFEVIVTTPLLADGSWRRLIDIAAHYDAGFVVILVASTFDIQEWTEALEYGAFDVLDALHELPRVAECAKRAAWAAYLKGAGQRAEAIGPSRAA